MTQPKFTILMLLVLLLVNVVPIAAQGAIECEDGFRSFEHEMLASDPVCVPENAERIAALDGFSTEAFIALGELPVIVFNKNGTLIRYPELEDTLSDVADAGAPINLEAVLAAEPDVIISLDVIIEEIYDELNAIAPTVSFNFDNSGQWKDITQVAGALIGMEDEVDALLASYDERTAALQETLGENPPVVSVLRAYPDQVNLYLRESFPGTIMEDAGIPRPESQDYDSETARELFDNPIQYTVSEENLLDADGDVIITWIFSGSPEGAFHLGAEMT